MRKHLLLFLILLAWSAIPAFSQQTAIGKSQYPDLPGRSAVSHSIDEAVQIALTTQSSPLWWAMDSTWFSQWNTTTTSWDLYEKAFNTYMANGSILQVLYVNFDMTTLSWVDWLRYVYDYYPSGGMKSTDVQAWDTADNIWLTVNHNHYNEFGRQDTTFYKSYDRLHNVFTAGGQTIYTYNGSNQNTETLNQTLDTATMNWVNVSRFQYTYDGSGHVILQISQTWDIGLNDWVNSLKFDFFFDGSGFATGYMMYTWDNVGSTWVESRKGIYTNNTSGQPTEKVYQQWDNGTMSWVNLARQTYQYNGDGKIIQLLDENWDDLLLTWVNDMKTTWTYFANGVQDEYTQYLWNPNTLAYMDTYFTANDTFGYQVEYYSKSIDYGTFEYTNGYKYITTYNPDHRPLETLQQLLNLGSLTWYDYSRRTDTYDVNGNLVLELDEGYDTLTTTWSNQFKQEHFYSDVLNIREIPGVMEYCYFANPLQAGRTVVCPNLEPGKNYNISLISLQGQMVFTTSIRTGETFTVPTNLSSGMYLMQIIEDGKVTATGKVVII